MENLRSRGSWAALVLLVLLLGGLTACGGEGTPDSLPSTRPSGHSSPDRTVPTAPDAKRTTAPAKIETTEKEPVRTETTKSQAPETRPATEDPAEEPAEAVKHTPAATSATTTAVVVAEDDAGGLGPGGWLLLTVIGLCVVTVVVLLANYSHQNTTWDDKAQGLIAETRAVLAVRLPPVLTAADAAARGLVWPSVRADLTALEARWAALLDTTPGSERQVYAAQVSGMLRDLVDAVDAENQAMASGQSWRALRPRLDAVVAALTAALGPAAATEQVPV